MFRCFHCGSKAVLWDQDFSFSDCCYDGDGIVSFFHCTECDADYECRIKFDEPEDAVTPDTKEVDDGAF